MSCNKKSFESQWDAIIRLKEIQQESKENKIPQSSYKCTKCNKWHLTSITSDNRNARSQKIKKKVQKSESIFIKTESNHWNKKFGIEE